MDVRFFALLSDDTVERAAEVVRGVVASWGRDWGVDGSLISIECMRSSQRQANAHFLERSHVLGASGKNLWIAWSDATSAGLQRLIFPQDVSSAKFDIDQGLVAHGAQTALDALLAQVASKFGVAPGGTDPDAPPVHLFAKGSGALFVTILIDRAPISMLLDYGCVASLTMMSSATIPLDAVSIKELVDHVPVLLPVSVGSVGLSFNDVMTLAVGDVLCLDRRHDQPFLIVGPQGDHIFSGYPAQQDADVVLQVAADIASLNK